MYEGYKLYGPYKSKKDGRLRCVLTKDNCSVKITISYPKYIYEKHFNTKIPDGYEIHHKDENPLNNNIDNLECVEKKNHARFHGLKQGKEFPEKTKATCVFCKKDFYMSFNQARNRKAAELSGKSGPFCSKSCVGQWSRFLQIDNGINIS